MRIKVNASAFEIEVLDRNDKNVLHIKCENYRLEGDTEALTEELRQMIKDVNSIG